MIAAEPAAPPRARIALQGHAFGLGVHADFELPRLGTVAAAAGLPRSVVVTRVPTRELDRAWPRRDDERAAELRFSDGRLMLAIDRAPGVGYRVHSPGHGAYIVAADGRSIVASETRISALRFQRLFYAQVLPLAAALQGLELLHASAVELGGRAVAFVAASGTGKSSICAHLVAGGARFVTDDVLAVEPARGRVLAHPGPASMNLDPAELAAMDEAARRSFGRPAGRSGKLTVTMSPADAPVALGALCFLRRGDDFGATRRVDGMSRGLLAAGFLIHLRTPERLMTHLDTTARIAAGTPVLDIVLPAEGSASDSAVRIREALEEVWA